MILTAFFFAVFGATSHFELNIIYDVAIVSVATAVFIWWRRPKLRWQILGGGLSFTVIYTVVLVVVGLEYPDFYDHWNHKELSGECFAGAPIEEYLRSWSPSSPTRRTTPRSAWSWSAESSTGPSTGSSSRR